MNDTTTDTAATAPAAPEYEVDGLGNRVYRTATGEVIDPSTGMTHHATAEEKRLLEEQTAKKETPGKDPSGQTTAANDRKHAPDSNAAHGEAIRDRVEDLARAMPVDPVTATAYRDYIAPVLEGNNVDRYTANKALATLADFENVPARAGQIEGEGFEGLKKLDQLQGLKSLASLGITGGEHMDATFVKPDGVTADTQMAFNAIQVQKTELSQQATHDLPPLSRNSANA